jgi:hypothetical protein
MSESIISVARDALRFHMHDLNEIYEPCTVALSGRNPSARRSFPSCWSDVIYLIGKTHFWLYVRKNRNAARRYACRLRQTCQQPEISRATDSLVRAWALAIIQEANGHWRAAARRRDRFGHLLSRLYSEADSVEPELASYVLTGFGKEVVQDHFARLSNDYRQGGRKLADAQAQADKFAARHGMAAMSGIHARSS